MHLRAYNKALSNRHERRHVRAPSNFKRDAVGAAPPASSPAPSPGGGGGATSRLNPHAKPFEPVAAAARGEAEAEEEAGEASGARGEGEGERRRSRRKQRKRGPRRGAGREQSAEHVAVQVVGTHTRVDVLWQDGTVLKGAEAVALLPVRHLGEHDFWPEEYVLERSEGGDHTAPNKRVGLIRKASRKATSPRCSKRAQYGQVLGTRPSVETHESESFLES
eukprot:5914753-Pyramimonas_sp.AAC.4